MGGEGVGISHEERIGYDRPGIAARTKSLLTSKRAKRDCDVPTYSYKKDCE